MRVLMCVVLYSMMAGEICTAEPVQQDAKTIIIGAGMTGAMAAKTLHKAGETDFIILEAASRVGGRMWHVPFGGETVELGAHFFHGIYGNPVWDRANELNMSYARYETGNQVVIDHNGNDRSDEYNIASAEFSPSNNEAYAYTKILQCNDTEKQDTSYRRLLFQFGWEPKTMVERLVDHIRGEIGIAQYREGSSARNYYDWTSDDFDGGNYLVTDPRGYSYIAESFLGDALEEEDERLHLGTNAISITQNETHVNVVTPDATFTAEYVLCTVSLGVLQQGEITWAPPFTEEKVETIMQNQIGPYIIPYLKFDEEFWGDADRLFYVDSRPRYWTLFTNMNYYKPDSNILQALIVGEEAKRVQLLSNEEVQAEIMSVLRNMYGPDIPDPTEIIVPRWSELRNFHGSYSDWPVGYDLEMNRKLRHPHGRVHFAGEAMSSRYFGYVHGAYYEGIRGAEFLMECMENEDCQLPLADECPRN